MKAKFTLGNLDFSFTDADVCNLDDFIPTGESNPHNVRPWLLHDHGFTLAVVFAESLQDAIDIASDEDRLGRYIVEESELAEGGEYDSRAGEYDSNAAYERLSFLGNSGIPCDIDTLEAVELPNPCDSFVSLFNAWTEKDITKSTGFPVCGDEGCNLRAGHKEKSSGGGPIVDSLLRAIGILEYRVNKHRKDLCTDDELRLIKEPLGGLEAEKPRCSCHGFDRCPDSV